VVVYATFGIDEDFKGGILGSLGINCNRRDHSNINKRKLIFFMILIFAYCKTPLF
jgi:hypothetical protein